MSEQGGSRYQCLRCGLIYPAPDSATNNGNGLPQERTCPQCRSNSVRWLREKKR